MTTTYPQETLGTTLLDTTSNGERRRVYLRLMGPLVEVGEFTSGPLTQELYHAPAHIHSIHLRNEGTLDEPQAFFLEDEPFLADYMDHLDDLNVPYGYMNTMMGRYVSYRPAARR